MSEEDKVTISPHDSSLMNASTNKKSQGLLSENGNLVLNEDTKELKAAPADPGLFFIDLDFYTSGGNFGAGLQEYFACNDRAAQLVKKSHMLESDNPNIAILENIGLAEEFRSYYNEC